MRSAPAGSSVNAQGLTIANGIPLSRMRSSPYKSINCYTTTQGLLEQRINQSRASDQCIRMQLVIQHQNQVQYNFFIHFSCMKLAIEKSRAFASELM